MHAQRTRNGRGAVAACLAMAFLTLLLAGSGCGQGKLEEYGTTLRA